MGCFPGSLILIKYWRGLTLGNGSPVHGYLATSLASSPARSCVAQPCNYVTKSVTWCSLPSRMLQKCLLKCSCIAPFYRYCECLVFIMWVTAEGLAIVAALDRTSKPAQRHHLPSGRQGQTIRKESPRKMMLHFMPYHIIPSFHFPHSQSVIPRARVLCNSGSHSNPPLELRGGGLEANPKVG